MDELSTLESLIDQLDDSSQNFARDLVTKGRKWGLSERQMYWVNKLIARARGEEKAPEAKKLEGDLKPMMVMLQFAKQHLKFPKVRLLTPKARGWLEEGERPTREWMKAHTLRLGIAGPKSKYAGQVNVTDDYPYGSNVWYGRIDKDGNWTQPRRELQMMDEVAEALNEFAKDPQQAASAYGRLMGHCCFCNRTLTDDRSIEVGYGPNCAEYYGLPWGR